MRYFGLHFGHDAGVAVFNDKGELEFFGQCERYAPRIKYHGLSLDPIMQAFPMLKPKKGDMIVLTALGSKAIGTVPQYDPYLVTKPTSGGVFMGQEMSAELIIDHHLAHAVASFCYREDDDERLFLSYDGAGSSANGVLKYFLVGAISGSSVSYYPDAVPIPTSMPICELLGPNSAGKAMGLAGYKTDAPPFVWTDDNFMKFIHMSVDPNQHCAPRYPKMDGKLNGESMDFVASFYKYVTNMISKRVQENIKRFANGRGVVLGGGTALALEINTKVHEMAKDVVFGPPVNDSGLALGAAAFGFYHANKKFPKVGTPAINALQRPLPMRGPQDPQDIAKWVAKGEVVALMRGQAEAGPRALGYRSILASAADPNNLKRVSQDIKAREFYRPLAPIVTAEAFDRYFVGPKGEYMQYRVTCTEECQNELPAIVHNDLSARPQVVFKDKDPWMHRLLTHYGEITGHECMINTSLNGPGKPICNSYEDAAADMRGKDVEIVCIPTQEWKLRA